MMTMPGDILLYKVTPKSGLLSRLIAVFQLLRREGESEVSYSHASILEDDVHQIEAWWPKSRRSAVNWQNAAIEVWRVIDVDPALGRGAAANAQSRIGQWYNVGELLFGAFRIRRAAICTRLVADSWASQGVSLAPGAGKLMAPNELAASPLIRRVT